MSPGKNAVAALARDLVDLTGRLVKIASCTVEKGAYVFEGGFGAVTVGDCVVVCVELVGVLAYVCVSGVEVGGQVRCPDKFCRIQLGSQPHHRRVCRVARGVKLCDVLARLLCGPRRCQ
ncbi:hypothetical protein GALL_301240 [mine drainage metagenome]|uniref:Uncharacterized protein n=1 Tax=mine drainage metagenome TaxID=410659 RepID=A0A1J5QWQ1_9ZZZZ